MLFHSRNVLAVLPFSFKLEPRDGAWRKPTRRAVRDTPYAILLHVLHLFRFDAVRCFYVAGLSRETESVIAIENILL